MDEPKYRDAERRLWAQVGLEPAERRVQLASKCTVRIQEVGGGEPALFIHGAPNAGATWAPMLSHLTEFRCLVVDRPGTGLSDPYRLTRENLEGFADSFVSALLDGLGIERAHVVASSFGGYLALRSAATTPGRIRRMVQMACPAMAPGMRMPTFMRLLSVRMVRRLVDALPPNDRVGRSILRQIGHGASLDAGRIPDYFFDWYLDLQRHTDTMKNDGDLIGEGGSLRGWDRSMQLTESVLRSVEAPTLFLWGEDDGFGGRDVAEHLTSMMPNCELRMLRAAGHLPWLDDAERIARDTAGFLRDGAPDASDGPASQDSASLPD